MGGWYSPGPSVNGNTAAVTDDVPSRRSAASTSKRSSVSGNAGVLCRRPIAQAPILIAEAGSPTRAQDDFHTDRTVARQHAGDAQFPASLGTARHGQRCAGQWLTRAQPRQCPRGRAATKHVEPVIDVAQPSGIQRVRDRHRDDRPVEPGKRKALPQKVRIGRFAGAARRIAAPDLPEPIQVGVVGVEHRIERGGGQLGHVAE